MGVLFKEPLSSEACLGCVEAAAFHHTYLRAGNMKNGGGQGITESQGITVLVDVYSHGARAVSEFPGTINICARQGCTATAEVPHRSMHARRINSRVPGGGAWHRNHFRSHI